MSYKTPKGETKSDICKQFNMNIKKLTNKAYIMSKRSLDAESVKNKLKILLDDEPDSDLIIKEAGPEIYKHRVLIEKKDKNFWDKVDFEKEYGHTENMRTYSGLFKIIKSKWKTLEKEETDDIGNLAEELLNAYRTYDVFIKVENGKIDPNLIGFVSESESKSKSTKK